jgi:hypothetical protein
MPSSSSTSPIVRRITADGWRIVAIRELAGTEEHRTVPKPMRLARLTLAGRQFEALSIYEKDLPWPLSLTDCHSRQLHFRSAAIVAGFFDTQTDLDYLSSFENVITGGLRLAGVGMKWLSSNVTIYDNLGGQRVLASFRATDTNGSRTTFLRHFTPTEAKILLDRIDCFNLRGTVAETHQILAEISHEAALLDTKV